MSARDELLIRALVEAAGNPQSKLLERRQADLAVWFYQNNKSIPRDNLAKRIEFLDKMVWTLLEVTALQTERIHELEGRGKSKHIWVPSGVTLNGQPFDG